MQHVARKWISLSVVVLAGLDILVILIFSIRYIFEIPKSFQQHWGISMLVAILAGVHLTYAVLIYPFLVRRLTWLSGVISFALAAMTLSVLIDASGNTNLVYRLSYAGLVFFMGITGIYAPLAAIILTWIVLGLTLTGTAGGTSATLSFNLVINLCVTIAGVMGWLIFRRFYIKIKTETEIQLTNLLQEEQFKSNIIIESITDGVVIVNEKGTIQLINKAAANLVGWKQEEAAHLDYRSIINIHAESDEKDAITSCLSSKQAIQKTQLFITQNGKERYIDTVASPVTQITNSETGDSQMVGVVAVLRDVDEQKRQGQQRNDFISTASHEMRTPIASIQGFLELAMNPKVVAIDEKARTYLTKAHQATLHLGKLFKDLLTISQNDDGRLQYYPKVIDLQQLVERLFTEAKMAAEKSGLTAVLDTGQGAISPLIYANIDPDRFQEVFMNLFENAIKYTKVGTITVGLTTKDNFVTLRISDTGMGIAQEDIPHIFQKFYRTDNSETRAIGGTGLGLYIVQQLVTAMKGRITVESTVGAGSSFYITIPRVMPEQLPKSVQKQDT